MPIDDPLDIRVRQLREASFETIDRRFMETALAGILAGVPGGASIHGLVFGQAQRNIHLRVLELFEEMCVRLREIEASIPDEGYYGSEEFQTLVALALEQIQTTHDKRKQKMLASALANSGTSEFHADNAKEQYVRTLRDLGPHDLVVLKQLGGVPMASGLQNNTPDTTATSRARLVAFGLIDERLVPHQVPRAPSSTREQDIRKFVETVMKPPKREYKISQYGWRFLQFLSSS
jgi:hypothetical protein